MEKEAAKILIQRTENGIDCGLEYFGKCDEQLLAGYPAPGQNAAITFKELTLPERPTYVERQFHEAMERLGRLNVMLNDKQQTHSMVVGEISTTSRDRLIELTPVETELQYMKFVLTFDYYLSGNHEWYPLEQGDQVQVCFAEKSGNTVVCEVQSVESRVNRFRTEIIKTQDANRQNLDIQCVAGHAVIDAEVIQVTDSGEDFGRVFKMGLNGLEVKGTFRESFLPLDIWGDSMHVGGRCRLWVEPCPPEKNGPYMLSLSSLNFRVDKRYVPKHIPEGGLGPMTMTVYQLDIDKIKDKVLLWAYGEDEDGTWYSCVYKSYIAVGRKYAASVTAPVEPPAPATGKKSGKKQPQRPQPPQWDNKPIQLQQWYALVRDYIPIGFPVQMVVDAHKEELKVRLLLRGFASRLKGRVDNDGDAQRHSMPPRLVMVSPYMNRPEEESILVCSPKYAGRARYKNVPSALIEYSRRGIFTTEMHVPAWVSIEGDYVDFNMKTALYNELHRLISCINSVVPMKICSISMGHVFMTSNGGYPVEYQCRDEREEIMMRQKMFTEQNFVVDRVVDDVIWVSMPNDFAERQRKLTVPFGGVFCAAGVRADVSDRCWHATLEGLDCQVLQETLQADEKLKTGATLILVGADVRNEHLIAVAHPERFLESIARPIPAVTVCELTETTWLCSINERFVIMCTSKNETLLLRHLQRIYGTKLPLFAEPLENTAQQNAFVQCRFGRIACGSDYRPLFAGEPVELRVPISAKTPRVLYYDAILTAKESDITAEPMRWVVPTGEVNDDGSIVCRRAAAPAVTKTSMMQEYRPYRIAIGRVVSASGNSVTFNLDDIQITVSGEHLHLPLHECASLKDIFAVDSEWSLKIADGHCELNHDCPDKLLPYSLIKQNIGARRASRRQSDWVVKSEDGIIAIAENIEDGEEGDTLLLIRRERTDYGIAYLMEGDEWLKGYELPVIIGQMDAERQTLMCKPVNRLTLANTYEIPVDLWGWNNTRLPLRNTEPLAGCGCLAEITDIRSDVIRLNRRLLLEQSELISGQPLVTGSYRMKVIGCCNDGYILSQNGVQALLPWNEASLSVLLDDETFRREYLHDVLLTVFLDGTTTSSGDTSYFMASWRSQLAPTIEKWDKHIAENGEDSYELTVMKVHHVGTKYLFLEYDEVLLYLSAEQLGLWTGQDLSLHFVKGQFLDCALKRGADSGTFRVELFNKPEIYDVPQMDEEYEAVLLRYENSDSNDCYVIFGGTKWTALVHDEDISWEPIPVNERPYPVGTHLNIRVKDVDIPALRIRASIKECLPRPLTGPAAENAAEHPQLQCFRLKSAGEDAMILLSKENVSGILHFSDCVVPPSDMATLLQGEKGCWLAVIGVEGNRLLCSQRVMREASESILCQLQAAEGGLLKQRVTIREVRGSRLLVSLGVAIGTIPRKECTGQAFMPLKELYTNGQQLDCAITGVNEQTGEFVGSVVRLYPRGMLDMLSFSVGSVLHVIIASTNEKGAYVIPMKDKRYKGFIPREEINIVDKWIPGDDLSVVCTDIDTETGIITFSRKQMLAPGVEE